LSFERLRPRHEWRSVVAVESLLDEDVVLPDERPHQRLRPEFVSEVLVLLVPETRERRLNPPQFSRGATLVVVVAVVPEVPRRSRQWLVRSCQ
jgi:hypothetical protein